MKRIDSNSGFKTPENYFEEFNGKLMRKLSEEKSVLSNTNSHQNDGFIVPKDYFKTLTDKIIAKVDTKETRVITLHPYHKYYLTAVSVAAIALLVFSLNQNTTKKVTFDTLAGNDIDSYFEDYELDFTDTELAELLPIHEIEISDIVYQGINEDKIIAYLNDTIEDFQELNTVYDEE
ncbi:MAG: hypothetical protein QM485_01760 [Flavobacteriaceae bacterium]